MTGISEVDFAPRVAGAIRELGYKVTESPRHIPGRKSFLDWLDTVIPGGPSHRPDILVEHEDRSVLVETKARPVLYASMYQALHYADHFDTQVVLCVPDDALEDTPDSVREFASTSKIHLCSESGLGQVLQKVLA